MYPSKILLFGEYTILLGSHALAIPYSRFSGEWDFASESSTSNSELKKFLGYLKSLQECPLNLNLLEEELAKGLYFKSSIPQASGLGSSGALVAAIFKRYSIVEGELSIKELKRNFVLLESFFHGSSSGIDPLVSYLKTPILIKSKDEIEQAEMPTGEIKKLGLFLVDTGKSGKTSNLVAYFRHKCNTDAEYLKLLQERYIPINNECIKAIIKPSSNSHFFETLKEISHLQISIFDKMILSEFVPHIEYGLVNELFWMKLCGSGGGGFYLGFSEEVEKAKEYFEKNGYKTFIL